MFKPLLFILIALGPIVAEQTSYPRTMYVAYQRAPLYESADYLSSIIGELKRGDSILVVGAEKKFFRVEHAGRTGFVLGSNLTLTAPKRKSKSAPGVAPPVRKESAVRADSPGHCSATTRSGTPCTRKADSTGLCWQHRKR
jgi:hypothetical protein